MRDYFKILEGFALTIVAMVLVISAICIFASESNPCSAFAAPDRQALCTSDNHD